MRSIMVCLCVLPIFLAILTITVDGGNISSKKIPAKLDDRTVICNVVQDSHSQEAIKSLEATLVATLEKKFDQLMEKINNSAHENSAGKDSPMLFSSSSRLPYESSLIYCIFFLDRSFICFMSANLQESQVSFTTNFSSKSTK